MQQLPSFLQGVYPKSFDTSAEQNKSLFSQELVQSEIKSFNENTVPKQEQVETPKLTTDDFFGDTQKVMDSLGITKEEAIKNTLNFYKTKGLEVEGIDIEAELEQRSQPKIDTSSFLGKLESAGQERLQREGEIESSDRNVFRKGLDKLANKAGSFSDIVGAGIEEGIEGVKAITPDFLEKRIAEEIEMVGDSFIGKNTGKAISTVGAGAEALFDILPEDIQQDVKSAGEIGLGVLDAFGTGVATKAVTKSTGRAIGSASSKTKNYIFPTESLDTMLSKVSQADTPDKLNDFKNALSQIDTTDIETYRDLGDAFDEKISVLSTKVDEILPTDSKYTIDELSTEVGNRKSNFVSEAIDDIEKVGVKENDLELLNKVDEFKAKELLSDKDLNDLSRFYGSKFKNKSFNAKGDPLSSVSAARFENNRKGIKNLVREKVGDTRLQEIDSEISKLFSSRDLVNDLDKKVQRLFNKTIKRGPLAGLGAKAIQVANLATGGFLGGALGAIGLQSNIGKKTLDILSIQGNLKKYLSQIDKVEAALDAKNMTASQKTMVEKFYDNLDKTLIQVSKDINTQASKAKDSLGDLADNVADNVGARAKFVDDSGKSLDDFKEVGTTESAKLSKIESYYKNKTGSDDVFDIMERFKKSSPENQEKVLKKASEFNVLDNYTSHQGRINSYLRKPEGTHLQETVNKANATIEEIRKLPKYEGEVYRGVSKYDGLDDLRIGDAFSDKAILSSSKSKIVADRFADDVMFEIESKKGRDLGDIGAMKSEQEVVFLPETKFSIKDIIKKKNKTIIKMTEE